MELELWIGRQHCQSGTPAFLERARRVTEQTILSRLDGRNDAIENIEIILANRSGLLAPMDCCACIEGSPAQQAARAAKQRVGWCVASDQAPRNCRCLMICF